MCQKTCYLCGAPRQFPWMMCAACLAEQRAAERRMQERAIRDAHFNLPPVFEHAPYVNSLGDGWPKPFPSTQKVPIYFGPIPLLRTDVEKRN